MALSRTARGTGSVYAGSTSYAINAASNLTAGALAVLSIAADNAGANGSAININSVTDSLGNVWMPLFRAIYDPGLPSAGVESAFFATDQSAGAIQTSTTITISFGNSTTAKAWTLQEVTSDSGSRPIFLSGDSPSGSNTASPSATTSTVLVGELVIGMVAMEFGTAQTYTDDTDTTNGTWSASQYAEIGSSALGISIGTQTKIQTTADSTQTFNPTLGSACDLRTSWIIIREVNRKLLAMSGVG